MQYSSSVFDLPGSVDQPLLMLDDLEGITGININDDVVSHLSSHHDKHGQKAN